MISISEELEPAEPMLGDADDDDEADHEDGERGGDHDMARHREEIGEHAEHVGHEHEGEQREHQREEGFPLRPQHILHHVVDELVPDFAEALQPARHQRTAARGGEQDARHANDGDTHEQGGVGEGNLKPADVEGAGEFLDLKLVDRIVSHDQSSSSSSVAALGGGFEPSRSCARGTLLPARAMFRMPAPKPRSRKIIRPKGNVPKSQSMP